MPLEFQVTGSGNPAELLALQEGWYEDVFLPDIGRLLREGIEWAGAIAGVPTARFSLSGRELFVLAPHRELNGFVSTPRLILGEEHVVLCAEGRLSEVLNEIALTESPAPTVLNLDTGIPAGWVGLRGVFPHRPVAASPDGDILDSLRPLANVEIALDGGIRIDRQTWLSGFPPTIRILGDTSSIGTITIDGRQATPTADSSYTAQGWDSIGEHTVWCTSSSRTYAIRAGAEEWASWDAYVWSLGEVSDDSAAQSRAAICGVLVRPTIVGRSDCHATVVAASNPVLIGARPGETAICTPRTDVRAAFCIGFPWFEPIWAIPADVLHCDKQSARVLLIGPPRPVIDEDKARPRRGRATRTRDMGSAADPWCRAILDAGRKGLRTEPVGAEVAQLWREYKRYARALRKGRR
jgi:hypothetical protein